MKEEASKVKQTTHVHVHVHVLIRDERRKKEATKQRGKATQQLANFYLLLSLNKTLSRMYIHV